MLTAALAPSVGTPTLTAVAPACDGTTPGIRLQWASVSGATNYQVYRNGGLIYTTSTSGTTFWNVNGLTTGQSYSYQVQAVSGAATSGRSNSLSATAPGCSGPSPSPTPAPTPGGNCQDEQEGSYKVRAASNATKSGANNLSSCGGSSKPVPPNVGIFTLMQVKSRCDSVPGNQLQWTSASGATAYEILRDNTVIYKTSSPAVIFLDRIKLIVGQTYNYFVRSIIDGVIGAGSNSMSIKVSECADSTKPIPTPVLTPQSYCKDKDRWKKEFKDNGVSDRQVKLISPTLNFETGWPPDFCEAVGESTVDSQGVSFGLLQFNFGKCSLWQLFDKIDNLDKTVRQTAFGKELYDKLNKLRPKEMIEDDCANKLGEIRSEMLEGKTLKDVWRKAFGNLGMFPIVHKAQIEMSKERIARGEIIAMEWGLKSERGVALAIDIAVQNWEIKGVGSAIMKMVDVLRHPDEYPEIKNLQVISEKFGAYKDSDGRPLDDKVKERDFAGEKASQQLLREFISQLDDNYEIGRMQIIRLGVVAKAGGDSSVAKRKGAILNNTHDLLPPDIDLSLSP